MATLRQVRETVPTRTRRGYLTRYRPILELLEDRRLLAPCAVDHPEDDTIGSGGTHGSLRYCMSEQSELITFAINTPATIQLASALPVITWTTFTIIGPTGIAGDIIIKGEGAADPYRIFEVSSGVTANIEDLTISHGLAPEGGGVKNSGTLYLSGVNVEFNIAAPLDGEREILGAGIYNAEDANLTISNGSRIRNNKIMGYIPCEIVDEQGFGSLPLCPHTFAGSAVYNGTNAELEFNLGSFVEFNTVCETGDVICKSAPPPFDDVTFYGAVFNNEGKVELYDSTVQNNTLRPRDPGNQQFRGHGSALQSGCGPFFVPCVTAVRSTFSGNVIIVQGEIHSPATSFAAHGAAISMASAAPHLYFPEAFISNSTFTDNWIDISVTDNGCEPHIPDCVPCTPNEGPCKTAGGIIWSKAMHIDAEFSTFVANGINTGGTVAEGGGLHVSSDGDGILTLKSVIVADNRIDGFLVNFGPIDIPAQSLGYNLFDDKPDCKVGTDQFRKNPRLQPLGDYGGVTETMRPFVGSPAINMGSPTGVIVDQRNLPRPVGVARDVGAVECQITDCVFEGDGPEGIPPPPGENGADGFGGIGGVMFPSASLGSASIVNQLPAKATTLEVQELPADTTAFFVDSAMSGSVGPLFYRDDPFRTSITANEFAMLGEIE